MPYANLPGLTNILRDNMLGAAPAMAPGKSLFVVGTALDGPDEPMRVNTIQDLEAVFGPILNDAGIRNGSTLVLGAIEAVQSGNTNVGVMRLGGTRAQVKIQLTAKDGLILMGRFKGDKYNKIKVELKDTTQAADSKPDQLIITGVKKTAGKVWTFESDATNVTTYTLSDYTTMGQLVNAINADTLTHGVVAAIGDDYDETTSIFSTTSLLPVLAAQELGDGVKANTTAGANGLNPTQATLRGLLTTTDKEGALDLLEDIDMDYIVVPDAYIDYNYGTSAVGDLQAGEVDFRTAEVIATFCHNASERNRLTYGSIAVKPLANPTVANIKKLVAVLIDEANSINLAGTVVDVEGNAVDLGRYMTFTVGESLFNVARTGSYHGPINISYFGLASSLNAGSATTNKPIKNVLGTRYNFSIGQLNDLAGARYVTLRERFGVGLVVTDGVTAALPTSDYTRFSTCEIVKDAVSVVSTVLDPFLGEGGSLVMFNSMNTALEGGLKAMKDAGALQDYGYQIISDPDELASGTVQVLLDLVPAFEVRNIQHIVTLHKSLQ